MKSRYGLLLAIPVICFFLFPRFGNAQGVSSSGTDYWLGFMPNGPGGGRIRIELFIGSGTKNVVRVNAAASVKTYTIPANGVIDVTLDQNSITSAAETPTDNAIHVTSANPITVYGYSVWGSNNTLGGSPDGYLGLPVTAYGREYYTVNYNDSQFGGFNSAGEFLIIAPFDNTRVDITPKGDTRDANKNLSHQAGKTFGVNLMKGQTYLVQSTAFVPGDNDLTGSHVVSDKPIALLTGHEITPIILGVQTSADHLLEMMPPVDKWGYQYFDMPMAGRTQCGDYIRVLSAEDGNQITYNGKGPFLLNKGEFAERDLQTVPEVYTSINHKKFVVMQYSYSQGFNGDPGTADPFMILMTAQEQFEKSMLFRTPIPAMDGSFNNYVTFICRYDSIRKITINGRNITSYQYVGLAQFPGTNPIMAGYRVKLPTGEFTYLAQSQSPFGAYQYGFSSYEGYGWPTGMAQKIISPDTLPPLRVTLDSSCGTYQIQFNEPRTLSNGFSFDDTRIASVSLITDTLDPRWGNPSYNYSFSLDPNFQVGDSVTTGTLTVNDPSQDAYGALYAVDRAGNDTVYQYHYYAPKISVSPSAPYDFGSVLYGSDSCRSITFKNVQAAGDFLAEYDSLYGLAKGGSFKITPTALSAIHAGDSVTLNVCFRPSDTNKVSVDSFLFRSHCVPYRYALRGTGVTPLIFAEDLGFGSVDSGMTKCLPLKISNPGSAPLTITKQDLANDPNFSIDPAQTFPIVIAPHKSVTVSYCFHPQNWGLFSQHVLWSNLNDPRFAHSIKDTSVLTGIALAAGARLTSYIKDFGLPSCGDKPVAVDTLYDNLPSDKVITNVKIIGVDAKYFTIIGNTPTYPYVLTGNNVGKVEYKIQFDPMLNGLDFTPRTATLQVYTSDGKSQPAANLKGVLSTSLVQVSQNTVNVGTGRSGQTLSGTFTISNGGNLDLNITSYGIGGNDPGSFTLTPPPPYVITPGGKQVITVTLTNTAVGQYSATSSLVGPCNQQALTLTGARTNASDVVLGTVHPKTFAGGCRSNTQSASFTNTSSTDTLMLTSARVVSANGWNDAGDFSVQSIAALAVAPMGVVTIPVVFTPQSTGIKNAALEFIFQGKDDLGNPKTFTEYAHLTGEGTTVSRTVAVGSVGGQPIYHDTPGGIFQVPITVNQPIEVGAPDSGSTEIYGYTFKASWNQDAFTVGDPQPPAGIIFTKIDSSFDVASGIQTLTFKGTSGTPITGATTLATFSMRTMVHKADSTPIVISNVQWLDQGGKSVCYVTNILRNSNFALDQQCGTITIQHALRGDDPATYLNSIEPNPVQKNAKITFTIEALSNAVSMKIYDVMGNEVNTPFVDQTLQKGKYAITLNASGLPSGMYFCRLTDGRRVVTSGFEVSK